MKPRLLPLLTCALLTFAGCKTVTVADRTEIPPPKDEPRVVNPGPPPSDAIVLFAGKDLSQWQSEKDGSAAKWTVQDGVMTVNKTGSIVTKQGFGDCQLHIEWATPEVVEGSGQDRGNSGVFYRADMKFRCLIPTTT
jgi:hypothetical protein